MGIWQDLVLYGNWGRILRVDLSSSNHRICSVEDSFFRKYLGGIGLASRIIFDEIKVKIDPLAPENLIVFSVGPFQGSGIPGSGKWNVSSISPLTGLWGETNGGGYWGTELKRTGFDAVVIQGRSQSPVYLWINDEVVEIGDGRKLWGKNISEADKEIKEEVAEPKSRALLIGPAGEKLVRFACVASDHGFGGRTGMGAVMGSKNLKAIVVRGTKEIKVAKPVELKEQNAKIRKRIHDATRDFREFGTIPFVKILYDTRHYGLAKNWREKTFEDINSLNIYRFSDIVSRPIACSNCPVACHRHTKILEPEEYAFIGHGPEYETIAMLGWLNMIGDAKAVAYAGHLCNELGLDTITMGAVTGFTIECYEEGLIPKGKLDGLEPSWGSPETLISLIRKVAYREGFGNVLAEGTRRASEIIGDEASQIAVHVKGLELPAHDPRDFLTMTLNYATGQRGAGHQRGFILQDESKIPDWGIMETSEDFGKKEPVLTVARYQDWAEIFNSLVQCEYMTLGGLSLRDQIVLINCVTGWSVDATELQKIGERIFTLQRMINVQFGVRRKDDTLPLRMFESPSGVLDSKSLKTFEKALTSYYKLRGWDKSGAPAKEKLRELSLE